MSADGSGDPAVAEKIQQLIKENKVMVFSKTYCKSVKRVGSPPWSSSLGPYCVKAKKVLGKYKLKDYRVLELDEIDNGDAYQKVLGEITDARTVPRVFIDGECIGGGDDTERLDRKGQLEEQLKKAGALDG